MGDETKKAASILLGRVVAQEFALKMVLCTQPRSERLAKCWDTLLLEQIDSLMEHETYKGIQEFRDAFHAQLATLRGFLDFTVPGFSEEDES